MSVSFLYFLQFTDRTAAPRILTGKSCLSDPNSEMNLPHTYHENVEGRPICASRISEDRYRYSLSTTAPQERRTVHHNRYQGQARNV